MSDLLKLTDAELLRDPGVIAAYRGLGLKINPMQGHLASVHIPGCIETVAFQMRSRLSDAQWQIGARAVYCAVMQCENNDDYGLNTDSLMWLLHDGCKADNWVCAATKAFEGAQI